MARSDEPGSSALVVIWGQESYSSFVSPDVLNQILSIDWERYAADISW
jgi:hypothetical protein